MSKLIDNLSNLTRTQNGAVAFASTGSKVLDYWTLACSFTVAGNEFQDNRLRQSFADAMAEDPDLAIRAMLNAYDVRKGAGRRDAFRLSFLAALQRGALTVQQLVQLVDAVPFFGRFDMLVKLLAEAGLRLDAAIRRELVHASLSRSQRALADPEEAALCAKWLPRKGTEANRVRGFLGLKPADYRHLLAQYATVETVISANRWADVVYEHVPSKAGLKYRAAFHRHDGPRYQSYLDGVAAGTESMHQSVSYPYEIVSMASDGCDYYSAVGAAAAVPFWKALLANADYDRSAGVLPIVDVSGSMFCPLAGGRARLIDAAIGLGLYLAHTNQGLFANEVVTFSHHPEFLKLTGEFDKDLLKVANADWGRNTNLDAVFDTMLSRAVAAGIAPEEMPRVVLVLSDMEFDPAKQRFTGYEMIRARYDASGYPMPLVVFWKLASSSPYPSVASQPGVVMVSGFSPNMIKPILECDFEAASPLRLMRDVLMDPRYDVVKW